MIKKFLNTRRYEIPSPLVGPFFSLNTQKGQIATFLLVAAVIAFGALLASGQMYNKSAVDPKDKLGTSASGGTCCDSGDGDKCQPKTGSDEKFTYKGEEYGLIKSSISLMEGSGHLHDTGEKFKDHPIIESTTETIDYECGHHEDQVFGKGGCVAIPDNEILYVCVKNCDAVNGGLGSAGSQKVAEYDAYFRLSDIPSPGVPDVIKNCEKASATAGQNNGGEKIVYDQQPKKENLQLNTFHVEATPITGWLSPYCKPAIYLYPEVTMPINVKINPVGKIKLTIPLYPTGGWNVVANPMGEIISKNSLFDYLYYEAEIPDENIEKPTDGYVVEKNKLSGLFATILPKLGLNQKEKNQFIEYWLKTLPNAPYYFVGVVAKSNLDAISPLTISPAPVTSIRVTLYFEPLENPMSVTPPNLPNVYRRGFTMVEWGGIFKKSAKYPFSCFQ